MATDPRSNVVSSVWHIVTMLNEVQAGVRPARVLWPLFAVHLRGAILRTALRPGPVARVHRLAVIRSVDGVYEAVAVCRRGDRFGAVGLRLARAASGRVLVTDIAHPGVRPHPRGPLSDLPGRRSSAPSDHR